MSKEEKPISQSQEEEDRVDIANKAAANIKISSPLENRRGGLGDNISDELRKIPGGKYPAKVVDGIANFITKSPLIVKAANKIRSLPGGDTAVNVMRKTYGTVTSKPVLRTIKAASALASITAFPLGTIAGTLSLAAIAGNVVKETLDVREIHRLDAKIKNLESIKKSKQQEVALIVENSKTTAKDSPALQGFLESKMPVIYPQNFSPNVPLDSNRLKEFGKAVRDSSLSAASLIVRAAEFGNPIGIVAAVATGIAGTLKEADSNLVRRKQINNKKNEVNKLHLNAEHYQNPKELQQQELEERVKAQTLKEFTECTEALSKGSSEKLPEALKEELSKKPFNELTKEDFERIYNEKKQEVESREEFKAKPERTKFQKFKSATRAGWGYFVESQCGDLKKLYSEKKEPTQTPVAPKVDKKSEQEKPKGKEKKLEKSQEEKKAHKVQQNLSKGQSTQYKNSISPLATPNPPHDNGGINH